LKRLGKTNVRLPLFLRVVALYVFVLGPLYLLWALQPPEPVLATVPTNTEPPITIRTSDKRVGQPAVITVPRLGMTLPIVDGEYDKEADTWTLSEDKAMFATITALPNNEVGNTFIYGHNTMAVFMPLAELRTGDIVRIGTTNGLTFQYRFTGKTFVEPDAAEILAPTSKPRLTLMTCEGIFSESRRVMYFDFEKVS